MNARRLRRPLIVAFVLVLIVAAVLLSFATRITPHVRDRAVAALNNRLRSEVELEALQISVFPRPEIVGKGLVLRHNGRTDVAPLIKIDAFSASAGLIGLISSPLRLKTVELERLEISIPPGGVKVSRPSGAPPAAEPAAAPAPAPEGRDKTGPRMIIDHIRSRSARLEIVPRDPGKLPRVFDIHDLSMHGVGEGTGAAFEASLTNPTPKGGITTQGVFGPWRGDEPGLTPVRGDYVFKDANLDTIKGIAGILSSTGKYSGVLERIEVQGDTDTPDFSIDISGQKVPLKTRFRAIVDGTNGDTWLDLVEAHLIDTPIVARGAVVRTREVKGRTTTLDVQIEDGRIEDVLKLATKSSKPLMTGRMRLTTALVIPAGDRDVIDKLELTGKFMLNEARFTNLNVQERINTLSQRGKGDTGDDGPSVVSSLSGTFTLRNGTLRFSQLSFGVPGAVVQLAGTYDLKAESLDFSGHLLLDAELAQTTTGFKSVLARVAQPLFRRPGGGSKLPIKITGPPSKPQFGLDVKRTFSPG